MKIVASPEFAKLVAYMASHPMPDLGYAQMRAQMDAFGARAQLPEGLSVGTPPGVPVPARLLTPANARAGLVLFAHGGGFTLGSSSSHAHVAAWLAHAASCPALIFDYRLAPEHPCPAALQDYRKVYEWALEQGLDPKQIVLAGDSAGANLSLSLLVNEDLPVPGALVALSPSFDLGTYLDLDQAELAHSDGQAARVAQGFRDYLGGLDAHDARASPSRGELSGLPPVFVQVAQAEVFAPDALDFAKRARAAGGVVEVDVWPEMMHDWHWYAPRLPEARQALEKAGDFILRHGS